jgi:hypothetical protein
VELWLCAQLGQAAPGLKFVPAKGGDDYNDAADLVPPYCFVEAGEMNMVLPGEPTYEGEASVTYVTHIDDTSSTAHSVAVRQISDALAGLDRGFDLAQGLIVHGTDVSGTDEVEDAERQSHGDVITVAIGYTG